MSIVDEQDEQVVPLQDQFEAAIASDEAIPAKNGVVKFLTREEILEKQDLVTDEVFIEEWGGSVVVRSLTGEERDEFEASLFVERKKRTEKGIRTTREMNLSNLRAKMVAKATYDNDGNRIFTDADAAALGKKNAAALQKIFKRAQELSGLTDEEVDELVAELGEGQSESSGSR